MEIRSIAYSSMTKKTVATIELREAITTDVVSISGVYEVSLDGQYEFESDSLYDAINAKLAAAGISVLPF